MTLALAYDSCGVRIDALTPSTALEAIMRLDRRRGQAVHLCNAYVLSLAARDQEYADLLNSGALNLADGTPVAWVGKLRGLGHMGTPVRGAQLMLETMRSGVRHKARHYIYGSRQEVVERLTRRLMYLVPGICIVGQESPPFRELWPTEYDALVERLTLCAPDFVWVGTGTPRQDKTVAQLAADLPGVFVAVGAAFDFLSGNVREAPAWLHGTGLEWLHRLLAEPRRLWRRYLVGNSIFLINALRHRRR